MATINQDFLDKVIYVSKRLNIDPKHLVAVMKLESGMNPVARNRETGAIGLIQFLPNTALEIGTTTAKLCMMSAVEQLDYVEKYLSLFMPIHGLIDLYLCILLPGSRKSKTKQYIEKNGRFAWAYEPNKGLDYDKDGVISHSDLEKLFEKIMQGNLWEECMSYLEPESVVKWPIFFNDPFLTPSQNIIRFLRQADEERWSLSNNKDKLTSLISRGVDGPYAKYVVGWKTNCATSALGFIAAACETVDNLKSVHPLLAEKSEMGTSVSRLVKIAQDKMALGSPNDPSKIKPGCLLWYCTPGKNDDHFEWLLSDIDIHGHAEHAGGGRADNAITVASGNVLTSFGRPLHKYIDVDYMLKDLPKPAKVDAAILDFKDDYAKESVVISTKSGLEAWLPNQDNPIVGGFFGIDRAQEPVRLSTKEKTKNIIWWYAVVTIVTIVSSYLATRC